jgi:hypothetical protein
LISLAKALYGTKNHGHPYPSLARIEVYDLNTTHFFRKLSIEGFSTSDLVLLLVGDFQRIILYESEVGKHLNQFPM